MTPVKVLKALAFLLVLAFTGAVIAWRVTGFGLGHWAQVHTGIVNEAGPYYAFFSGVGSDIGEIALVGAVGTLIGGLWHKWNCHNENCWRIGLHHVAGGQYVVCRRHHNEITGHGSRKLSTEFLREVHRLHLSRLEGKDEVHSPGGRDLVRAAPEVPGARDDAAGQGG